MKGKRIVAVVLIMALVMAGLYVSPMERVKANPVVAVNYIDRTWDGTKGVVVDTPSSCESYTTVASAGTDVYVTWENDNWYGTGKLYAGTNGTFWTVKK